MTDQNVHPADTPDKTPLVVDLDGTLSRSDTLHEALLRLVVRRPLAILGIMAQLRDGKVAFKAHVADQQVMPPTGLMLHDGVLDMVRVARAEGRETLLVSASDHRQVQAVAEALGIFDHAFGTSGPETAGANLGGRSKAAFLMDRYGHQGFDYVGDCAKDLPVWKAARQAFAVAPSARLTAQAKSQGITLHETPKGAALQPSVWMGCLKALRPHQWSKNILVFLPMLAAQDMQAFGLALMAFVLFSLTASSVYIFNDLIDLPADRAHPRKCLRPFASGAVPISTGIALGAGLVGLSLLLAFAVMPPLFLIALAVYFAVTVAYSFVLKRKLIVDVITLAGLYTMRIIAGGAATAITPSPWLLAFSVFLFYSLAAIKRQAELVDQLKSGKQSSPGRGYLSSDTSVMQMMAISSGQAAVLVFALYLYSPAVTELYAMPEILWLICPVLLYWLSRVAILTHRGEMEDDPIVFAARDRISQITVVVVVAILLAAERGF